MTTEPLLRRVTIGLALVIAGLAAVPAVAQQKGNDYALIYGTVWGPDNRPLAGVPIKIRRSDKKKAQWELVSDRRGEFAQRVPPGKAEYLVWADIKHPKGENPPQTTAQITGNERIDISLHLAVAQVPKKP